MMDNEIKGIIDLFLKLEEKAKENPKDKYLYLGLSPKQAKRIADILKEKFSIE